MLGLLRTLYLCILYKKNAYFMVRVTMEGGVNPYGQSDHKKALFWTTPLRIKWMDGVICLLSLPFEMTS